MTRINHRGFQGDPGHEQNAIRTGQLKQVHSEKPAQSRIIFFLLKSNLIEE